MLAHVRQPPQSTTSFIMAGKQIRVWIDPGIKEEWDKRHGDYASLSWLMETAMRAVLDETKDDPTLTESVKAGIRKKLAELYPPKQAELNATT